MLGEKALSLIRELQRTSDVTPPVFNDDGVRQVLEEIKSLFEENRRDVDSAEDGQSGLLPAIKLRHYAVLRNKRCVLAYLYNRLQRIRKLRWSFGSLLPADVKYKLSETEVSWFNNYNKSLAMYMRSIGGDGGFDLTQDLKPPKTLHVEVRCLVDHGDFETQDGSVIALTKNSQHFLLRSESEYLIRQGILEHIVH
ncbi:DNA replication complex GINS protein PSF1-like [Liolophura sinensis]|uniref:DNA replication complex GINS protein PSF1-like n=1 Tax=Liolophura sinensis TaxID=3198878 RepID=UPI003159574C